MKHSLTRKSAALAFLLFGAAASNASAAPTTVTGPAALALATVVAQHSPLPAYDKKIMARLFAGGSVFLIATKTKFSVAADTIVCRTSNVDIAARSCDLTFKVSKKTMKGREANELYATAATAGVVPEGAAGSNIESFSKLNCTIDARKSARRPAAARSVRSRRGKQVGLSLDAGRFDHTRNLFP